MSQLTEFIGTRQIEGEPKRRWFSSETLDLIVWSNEANLPFKFQLCYDTDRQEHALTWEAGRGFDHSSVDSRKTSGGPASPILVPSGAFDRDRVREAFAQSSCELEAQIGALVTMVLDAHPDSPDIAARRPPPLSRSEEHPWWKFWA